WRAVFLEHLHRELLDVAPQTLELIVVAPRVHAADPEHETRLGIRVERFDYGARGERLKESRPSFWRLLRFYLAARRRLAEVMKEFRPDGILAHWVVPSGAIAAPVARRAGLPLVLWAHGSDLTRFGRRPIVGLLARAALRRARLVLAVSRELRRIAIEELGADPDKVTVLPMGVARTFHPQNSTRSELPSRGDRRDDTFALELLYVGDLTREKGVEDLLLALDRAWARGCRARLRTIGSGPMARDGSSLRSAPPEAVVHLGPRRPEEIAALLREVDLLVHASWREGAPLAVMEALACGTPVVATAVGGIPELVTEDVSGWLVPARDTEALASVLCSLAERPERIAEARARLASSPADHSMRSRVEILWPLLAEALGGGERSVLSSRAI
ncbi:MAG TPA: glycosyltransferase, partial [Planctomycetota bacterium]|nr:glycosyltransferase [Planctomycetota bacterium]